MKLEMKTVLKKIPVLLMIMLMSFVLADAGQNGSYSYAAQKKLIPAELGKIYLGMPFDELAGQYDLAKADVGDTRFDWLELTIPISKGGIEDLTLRIYGLSQEDKKEILVTENAEKVDELGYKYQETITRLNPKKIPAKGIVYALYVGFKKDFDLKSYVLKTYGGDGLVRKPDDEYHFYDIQWNKKTSDGLVWLIRSFHEGDSRSLQLLGRIEGTEWGLDD